MTPTQLKSAGFTDCAEKRPPLDVCCFVCNSLGDVRKAALRSCFLGGQPGVAWFDGDTGKYLGKPHSWFWKIDR